MTRKTALVKICLLLSISILMFLPKPAYAKGQEYVVVAWDEEFAAAPGTVLYKYTWIGSIIPLTAETYSEWQWSRALYHFNNAYGDLVNIQIIGNVEFDSEDDGNLADTLYEAIEETGFRDGIYFDGKRATILMVWTLQNNDGLGGGTLPDERAFIVKHQEAWADDNTLLHELTHIWIGDEGLADTEHGEWLMSYTEVFMGLYNEPLQPEWGFIVLSIFQTEDWSYFAYEWCETDKALMRNHLSHEYPPPPDPWMEELRNDPTYRYYFWIALVLFILFIAYLLTRSKRLRKTKIAKAQNSSFNILTFTMLPVPILVRACHFLGGTRPISDYQLHHTTQHRRVQRYNHLHLIRQQIT